MPRPFVQDMLDTNALAKEALSEPELGIQFHPIPLQFLRIGTVTDASWGNARQGELEQGSLDFWEERADCWVRHHRQPRTMLFHPGGAGDGPDLLDIGPHRATYSDGERHDDEWNTASSFGTWGDSLWTGQTVFSKATRDHKKVNEKFLQRTKVGSQAGYLIFFYDQRLETEEKGHFISLVDWKSFRVKRNTVNTLSAECQALVSGVGAIYWQRFLLQESRGHSLSLSNWAEVLGQVPFIAVTDSKSLYDTLVKLGNAGSRIEDKRTAIDVTLLRGDMSSTRGQVRWVPEEYMIADSLTKRMSAEMLKRIMRFGKWSLSREGCIELRQNQLLMLSWG